LRRLDIAKAEKPGILRGLLKEALMDLPTRIQGTQCLKAGALVRLLTILASIALCSCGGGSGSSSGGGFLSHAGGSTSGAGGNGNAWKSGVFQPSTTFVNQCAAPRTGNDPLSGKPYPDMQGSTLAENNWLRSWTNELYLWYSEVTDVDPSLYTTPDYFNQLKTFQNDAAGQPKDKFHFTYPTSTWETLSTADVQPGYGAQWVLVSDTPPRKLVVASTIPNTPATTANLARGAQILTVDGADLVNANDQASVNTINAGISPAAVGETHTFTVLDLQSNTPRTITLTAQNVTEQSVPLVSTLSTSTETVGYIVFDDHQATAEAGLIDAVNRLKSAGISDLVLDMRYNGGGYLDIASELAYMIAGPGPTTGEPFYNVQFNNKYPSTNPVLGTPLTPVAFHTQTQGFSVTTGQPLPTLNLSRVFVLTGPSTCSASEAVINGLQGVNVKVIQIGSTTCGKPYGFYPQDNCGTTYFSIEFRGINAQGFGDYPDGFTPSNSNSSANGASLPGCQVADDFTHALGDPAEARLSAALNYTSNPTCPAPSAGALKHATGPLSAADGRVVRPSAREILILRQ
jgi:carboxyl-terminal processing protease